MLQAGKHNGKLTDYAMGTTQTGKPQFIAVFDIEGESITYRGVMDSDKQKTMNLKAMADLGLTSPEDLVKIADGPDSGVLEIGREVSLTLEERPYNGKSYLNVKWINPLGGSKFKNDPVVKAQATSALASLKGEAAAILASRGVMKKLPEVPF